MDAIKPIIRHMIDLDTIHDASDETRIGAQRYHCAADHGIRIIQRGNQRLYSMPRSDQSQTTRRVSPDYRMLIVLRKSR